MRGKLIRSLALAGALVALTLPVANMMQINNSASACSNPGCVINVPISGGIETYFSPIAVSATAPSTVELALAGETNITVTADLNLSATDWRSNNQGFVLTLLAGGASTNASPTTIPGSDFYAITSTATTVGCYGLNPEYCSGIQAADFGTGQNIGPGGNNVVAAVCRADHFVGNGVYSDSLGFQVRLLKGTPEGEVAAQYGMSWTYNFTFGALEGDAVTSYVTAPNCTAAPVPVTQAS
jgi:hypothetical protein